MMNCLNISFHTRALTLDWATRTLPSSGMTRSRKFCVAMAAVGVAAMLTGCSAPSTQESPGGRIIAVSGEATDAQPQALIEGTAEWGHGGCMVIRAEETYLVMFPHGTTIDDNDEVVFPGGHRVREGDRVELGGGFHALDTSESDLSAIPEACLTEEIFSASGEVSE